MISIPTERYRCHCLTRLVNLQFNCKHLLLSSSVKSDCHVSLKQILKLSDQIIS